MCEVRVGNLREGGCKDCKRRVTVDLVKDAGSGGSYRIVIAQSSIDTTDCRVIE